MPSNSVLITPTLKRLRSSPQRTGCRQCTTNSDVEAGGLMSYGTDDAENSRRAATM